MKVYHYKQVQHIPASLDTVWEFFSTPKNLNNITPPDMNFVTTYITGGEKMYEGQLISYRVSPFPLVRLRWTTEIKNVSEKKFFIDEQRFGPFALWYHQHFFYEKENGVEMIDEVSYAIPLGFLGRIVNALVVGKRVEGIFAFRKRAVEKIFPLK
jgi:ligand-binding SRPBCC domain-containing protein